MSLNSPRQFDSIRRRSIQLVVRTWKNSPYRKYILTASGILAVIGAGLIVLNNILPAKALVQPDGRLLYGDATNLGQIKLRVNTFDYTFNTEINTTPTSTSSHIAYIVSKAAPTRDEIMVGHLKVDGRLDVVRGTAGYDVAGDYSAAWNVISNNAMTCTGTSPIDCTRTFDIAYEQLSGRAMVVYAGDTSDSGTAPDVGRLYYCYFDGTSWGPVSNCAPTNGSNDITLSTTGGRPIFVELKSLSGSDRIILGTSLDDSGVHEAEAMIWSGSSWGNAVTLTDTTNLSTTTFEKGNAVTVAWESTGSVAIAVYGTDDTNNEVKYKRYNGSWGSETGGWNTFVDGSDIIGINSERDPVSNRIAVATNDSSSDAMTAIWKNDNSTEGFTTQLLDSTIENQTTGPPYVDVMWQSSGSRGITFAQNAAGVADPEYHSFTCTTTCSFSSTDTSIPTSGGTDDGTFVRLIASPNSTDIMALYADIDRNLMAQHWDGSAWEATNAGALEVNVSGAGADTTIFHNMSATFQYVPYNIWQRNWRFFDDETANDPSIGLNGASENTRPTDVEAEEFIRLRVNVYSSHPQAETDARKKLQYTSGCNPNSAGGEASCTWTDVGDTDETSAVWRYATSGETCSNCSDNNTFSINRLTGSTQTGWYTSDKDAAPGSNMDHNSQTILELDYPLKAENVDINTTYYFRLFDVQDNSAIYREQDNDGSNDCASTTCTYPSLTTAATITVSGGCFTNETEGTACTASSEVIKVAVNGAIAAGSDIADGSWSFTINGPSSGAILVFFVDGETTESEEATTVIKYDGSGNVDQVKLYQSQLVIGADSGSANADQTITVTDLDTAANGYENSDDEDVLYDVTAGADLVVDAENNKDEQLYIISGDTFRPASGGGSDLTTHDLTIDTSATLTADTNQITASGSFVNNGSFSGTGSQTTILTSTATNEILSDGSSSFRNLYIDNGLVGYWKFDNNAAPDNSGDGNDLSANGTPAFSAGVNTTYYGNNPGSLSLNGTNSYADSTPSSSLQPSNNFSITAWIKTSSTDLGGAEIVSMGDNYMVRINTGGAVEFIFRNGTGWTNCQTSGVNVLSGSWVSIAAFKSSSSGSEVYVDNVDRTSGCTSTANVVYDQGTSFNIGRHGNGSGNFDFIGEIDDVRVYNRVISTNEISDWHNGNHPDEGTYVLQNALDVDVSLEIRTGLLDTSSGNNYAINVFGSYINVANFEPRNGVLTLDGTTTGHSIQADESLYSLTLNGAGGSWLLDKQRLDVNNNLTITTGTLDVSTSSCNGSSSCNVQIGNNYSNSGTFTARTGTVTFDATDTGNTLSGTLNGSSAFYNLTFNGSAGEWSVNAATLVSRDFTVTAGTVIGSNTITVNRHVTGAGTINLSGGTFEQRVDASITSTANFGTTSGTANWTFNDLTFSNSVGLFGSLTVATQTGGSGTITVAGVLRVGKSGDADTTVLNAGNRTWTLSGTSGDPFQLLASPAADLAPLTSTFSYAGNNGAGDTTVQVETYNVLQINNGSETFNLEGNTTAATLTISAGTLALNGFTLAVNGVLTVNGTLSGSTNITVTDNVTGSGTITLTGGTFEQLVSTNNNFGSSSGSNEWRFATLIFSNSALGNITISPNAGTGPIRVDTLLQIGKVTDGARTTFDNNTANDRVLDVNGSVSITSNGTLQASNTASFTVGDDWTLSSGGVFNHNSGEVIFDTTTTARLTGATTFYKFTSTTPAKTLEFTAGQTFTIASGGQLTLVGAANPNWIHVHSSSPGTQWFINHQGTESVSYVHVSDSGCDLTSTDINTSNSINDGNNGLCWKFDPVFSQEDYRFGQPNGLNIDYSSAPAENTPYTTSGTGDDFRLRLLIHVADTDLPISGKSFKLQFGEKTGSTCSSGVSWADVQTTSGVIRYFDGTGINDGDDLTTNAGDPDHAGHTKVAQDYEEANNFTNSVAAIPAGQDGLWDFSLVNHSAVGGKRYCFRVTEASGTLLGNGYNQYPEVIIDEELIFTLDATSKDFGIIQPGGNPTEVSSTLTASTNSSTGYVIYTWATQQMTMGSFTISDWSGTNSSPTSWPNGSFGFGYTTDDSDLTGGTADRFTNGGAKYAGFVHTGPGDPVADRTTGPVSNQQNIITYRIAAGNGQQAGTYNTVIVYVISVTF